MTIEPEKPTREIVVIDISSMRHRLAAADEKGDAAIWSWR